jgi:putative ABC transport system ATP-binding protein
MLALNRDKGVTFLFSTHDPRVVKHARRALRIQDGVLQDGSFDERPAPTPAHLFARQ